MENVETNYMQADPGHPFMGLRDQVCHNPEHFCACHHVWLSEEDSQRRCCREKLSDDGTCNQCTAFMENKFESGIESLISKTRVKTARDRERERERKRKFRRRFYEGKKDF